MTDEVLLADVKRRLNITWSDEHTDGRMRDIIADGMAYIDDILGEAGDYHTPGRARSLLMDYARYARDEALDVFEANYRSGLLAARDQKEVARYGSGT
ncbi:MAG: hypothetical protein IJB67_01785 [Firmicutes bacterium]|nr:hypothetical protein [Bacillota bacterium]